MHSQHVARPNGYYTWDDNYLSRHLLGQVGQLIVWLGVLLAVLIIAGELILG